MKVTLKVNGENVEADNVWEGSSLLTMLRHNLQMPGAKNACEQGECGSCSVLLDGELVCACLVQAGQVEGRDLQTIEGAAPASGDDQATSVVQQAFIEAGAVQCGFCTPGFVMSVDHLLRRNDTPTNEDIREALSGNLCRCTGYEKILDAVQVAIEQR